MTIESPSDATPIDSAVATLVRSRAATQMLEFWLRFQGQPIPRAKALVAEVAARDLALGGLVEQFTRAVTPDQRLDLAFQIADLTLHARGFFEWDSGPDPVHEVDTSAPMPRNS